MAFDFPASPVVNQTYSYGTRTWIYNGTGWEIFKADSYGDFSKLDNISSSFNNVATTFSLTVSSVAKFPGTAQNLIISLDGVIQEPGVAYTVSSSNITFTEAPITGTQFFGVLLGQVGTVGVPADGSITAAKLSSTGVTAGTYGNATITPIITVDSTGRITSASNATISAGITTGKSIAMAIVFGG